MLGKRDMNFANPSARVAGNRRRKRLGAVWLPLLLALFMGLGFGALRVETLRLSRETEEIMGRLDVLKESAGESLSLARRQRAFCQNARVFQRALEERADAGVTGEMIRSSLSLAGDGVIVIQVSVRDGRLVLSARAGDYREAGLFAKRLRDSGLFSSLDYEGFQQVEDGYTFVVECSAAEEGQNETQ